MIYVCTCSWSEPSTPPLCSWRCRGCGRVWLEEELAIAVDGTARPRQGLTTIYRIDWNQIDPLARRSPTYVMLSDALHRSFSGFPTDEEFAAAVRAGFGRFTARMNS